MRREQGWAWPGVRAGRLRRRPTTIVTLALLAAGCLVLLAVHQVAVLAAGRLLMGLGAGLASSALTSDIVDAAPPEPPWLASASMAPPEKRLKVLAPAGVSPHGIQPFFGFPSRPT